jgi:hypothetical protein
MRDDNSSSDNTSRQIPDGIPDYKYVITGEAKAKANLPRRETGILMILTGKFQNLEKR